MQLSKPGAKLLGESRSQAVRRFISFERTLHLKGHFKDVEAVTDEYFQAGHADLVPEPTCKKPPHNVFYLPMHMVRKESSTTTKVRAVFDASAKSLTGVSLNDTLLVGPTVTSSLVDVRSNNRHQSNVACRRSRSVRPRFASIRMEERSE